MPDIIQKGGGTLEITYNNLTGKSDAITAFRNLIDPFFPIGNTPQLNTDNPFPLLNGNRREVNIDPETAAFGIPYIVRSGEAEVSPGILYTKNRYHFDIFSTPQMLKCVATAKGFGQPIYKWRIDGVDVPKSGSISPVISVTIDEPTLPNQKLTKTIPVPIQCTIAEAAFTSTLVMTFNSTVEHIDLVIEAFASEKFASSDVTSGIEWVTVDNEKLVWESQYYKDRAACEKRWRRIVNDYVRFDPFFNILFTLTDPPNDYARVFRQLGQLSLAIERLRERLPEDAQQIEQAVEYSTGINAVIFHDIGRLGNLSSLPNREQTSESSE